MKKIFATYCYLVFLGFFFLSPISPVRGQDSMHIRRDTLKADFVTQMGTFFKESSQKSLIDLEQDRAIIRQNKIFEEIKIISRQAGAFLKKGFDTVSLKLELDQIGAWHKLSQDGVFANKGSSQTSRNLTTTFNILNALQMEVKGYKRNVDHYQSQLVNYRLQIDSLTNDKSLFTLSHDSLELSLYLSRLKILAKEISPVNEKLSQNINGIQIVQNLVNLELLKLETDMDEIRYYQQQISDKSFAKEFASLWEKSKYDRPLEEIFHFSILKAKLLMAYYIKANWGKLMVLFISIGMVILYLFSLKNGIREQSGADAENSMLLSAPICSGTAIALAIGQFLFTDPPFVFSTIILFTTALLITIIFRHHISKYWMVIWLSILTLYLLAAMDNFILQVSRPERWGMIIIAVFGTLIGVLALFFKKQHRTLKEQWILFPICLMVIMEVMSIALNIFGRLNIAKVLMVSGLLNVVVAIVFLWVIRLVNEGLTYASMIYKKQERRLFYINYNRVGKRAPVFFYTILIAGWFILFGRNFYEFKLLAEPFNELFYSEHQLGSYTFSLYNILIFFLIMFSATMLSKVVSFFASDPQWRNHDERKENKFHIGSWILLVRISIIVLGLFLAFAAVGIPVQQITLIIGALGVGVGFGLQTLVNNLVSGLIIAFEKPVNVDDLIEISGQSGKVKSIGFRSSVIATADGADLIMPNGDLLNSHVINWTLGGMRKRVHIRVEVQYGTDLEKVRTLLLDSMELDDQILKNPAPDIQFGEVSAQFVALEIYFWVKTIKDSGQVKSNLIATINKIFQANGIHLAVPAQDIYLKNQSS